MARIRHLRFCLLIITFILLPSFLFGSDSPTGIRLEVLPESTTVHRGGQLGVEVVVSGLGDFSTPALGAFDLRLSFDPGLLQVNGTRFGVLLGEESTVEASADSLDLGADLEAFELSFLLPSELVPSQAGRFTLLTITFDAIGEGTTRLEIEPDSATLTDALGDILPVELLGAQLTVDPPQPDLSVTVDEGQDPIIPGQSVTYTITASNVAGTPVVVTGAVLRDVFPSLLQGVTWTCTPSGGATCTPAGSGDIVDTIDLPPGALATYAATGLLDPAASGRLENSATIEAPGSVIDPNPDNNEDTAGSALAPQADLAISKGNGRSSVFASEEVTYTIQVTNQGPSSVTGAAVTDQLPSTLTAAHWTCSPQAGAGCTASGEADLNDRVDLPVGTSVSYTVTGILDPAATGSLSNTAQVSVPSGVADLLPSNNSATDSDSIRQRADLLVTQQTESTAAIQDEELVFTLEVSNQGPSAADEIRLFDRLPQGVRFVRAEKARGACQDANGLVTCDLGSLEVGTSAIVRIKASVDSPPPVTVMNTVSVSFSGVDPNPSNDNASIQLGVVLDSDGDGTNNRVENGAPNGGDGNNDGVPDRLQDSVVSLPNSVDGSYATFVAPEGAGFSSVRATLPDTTGLPAEVTLPFGAFDFRLEGVPVGGRGQLTLIHHDNVSINSFYQLGPTADTPSPHWFDFLFDGTAGALIDGETIRLELVDGQQGDNNLETDGVFEAVVAPAFFSGDLLPYLSVTQDSATPVTVEQELTFTISLENRAPVRFTDVVLRDPIPTEFELVSTSAGQGECEAVEGTVNCRIGDLAPRATTQLLITVKTLQPGTFFHTVEVSSREFDPANGNVTSTTQATVALYLVFPAFLNRVATTLEDSFVGFATVNSGMEAPALEISGRAADGRETGTLILANPFPTRAQFSQLTDQLGLDDALTLIARGIPSPVQGFFMVGDPGSTKLDGIGGELRVSTRQFFPSIQQGAGEETTLFLFNPGQDVDPAVSLRLFDPQGLLLEEVVLPLNAQGSLLGTVDQFFGERLIEEGYVEVVSTFPIAGCQINSSQQSISSLAGQTTSQMTRILVPHFFLDQQGGTTVLRLLNTSPEKAFGTLKAYDDNSNLLSRATFEIEANSLLVKPVAALLELDSSQSVGGTLSGYLELDVNEGMDEDGASLKPAHLLGAVTFQGNQGKFRSTLPLVQEELTEILLGQVAQSPEAKIFTGLAILNGSDEPAQVKIQVFDEAGNLTAETRLTVAPSTRAVDLLNGTRFFGGDFQQLRGHIEMASDIPVRVVAFFGDYNSEYLSAIQAQQVLR
ncbi:MAG: choice-of-anchor U domain-containing protein [Acidobacteriota bacterium]